MHTKQIGVMDMKCMRAMCGEIIMDSVRNEEFHRRQRSQYWIMNR
jgi:hypothetical protein